MNIAIKYRDRADAFLDAAAGELARARNDRALQMSKTARNSLGCITRSAGRRGLRKKANKHSPSLAFPPLRSSSAKLKAGLQQQS